MQTEPSKAAPPKRKRRWFQFSLRTLMIFTVLCAIASAWLASKIEQKRKEREVVDTIGKLGGYVWYDYEAESGNPPGPQWMRQLLGENFFGDVSAASFRYISDADTGLIIVKGLPKLSTLDLADTNVTDTGLKSLEGLPSLQALSLSGTKVTDAALATLKRLPQLQEINLTRTHVSDAELQDLQKALPNCKIVR